VHPVQRRGREAISVRDFHCEALLAAVLAMSGLLAFMAFQWHLSDTPLSFADAQHA
jgi:hypothetical protein